MTEGPFKPAWWLFNSHLQTLWPLFCRRPIKNFPVKRERIELPDGDFLDLDWAGADKEGPLVLMLHGLEGSIESHYAKGMLQSVCNEGWRGVFMHFRGCSGEPNRLCKRYHSGETSDLATVIQLIQSREPNTPIAAVGISLGGNVLLKWLGETRDRNPLIAAIAISVPFDLQKTADRVQHGIYRAYQWYFLRCLRESLSIKFQLVKTSIDPSILDKVRTMPEFDHKITVPLYKFRSVEEYYTSSSSRQYLRHITVPTLILHAKDDPLMTEDIIPQPDELSEQVVLELLDGGGHVGFVAGRYPWRAEYWLEKRVPIFLRDYLPNRDPQSSELPNSDLPNSDLPSSDLPASDS